MYEAVKVSPEYIIEKLVDHISINKKLRSSLHDVNILKDEDVDSDPYILICKNKLKLKRYITSCNTEINTL